MTIQSINAIKPIANYPMIIAGESSIFDEVDELIKQYDAKPLERAEIATSAKQLIERFTQLVEENLEQNLPLAREGLCRLLKLNIEEVQLEALSSLQSLLHLNYLDHDIQNNSFNSLLILEKQISQALIISFQLKSSSKITPALLASYHFILERLWILPHLVENTEDAIIFLQENSPSMINESSTWIALLKKKLTHDNKLDHLLKRVQEMFQKIESIFPIKFLKSKDEVYSYIGNLYQTLKNYRKSIEFYEKNLQTSQEMEDKAGVVKAYANIGNAYYYLGEYRKALQSHEERLRIAQEMEDRSTIQKSYNTIGVLYQSLKDYDKAIEFQEKSIQIAQELKDQIAMGASYINMGTIYRYLGKIFKSIEYSEKALEITQQIGDLKGTRRAYCNFNLAYSFLGDRRKAIEYNEKALKIAQELEDPVAMSIDFGNLGNDYLALGDYRKAIEYLEKALKISQNLGDKRVLIRLYGSLGRTHTYLEENQKAIEYYQKSLQMAQDIGDREVIGKSYGNLGSLYESIGEHRKSIENNEKHLQIAQELKDQVGVTSAYRNLGAAWRALEDYQKALDYQEKSLKLSQEIGYQTGIGEAYDELGIVWGLLKDYKKALDYFEKYLINSQNRGDLDGIGRVYGCIATSYKFLNDLLKAEEYFNKSISIRSDIQNKLGNNSQWQISIFEKQAVSYFRLEDLLLEQGKLIEALEITEARRARALLSAISMKFPSDNTKGVKSFLTIEQIQKLAQNLQTTFIIYSLSLIEKERSHYITAWIIPNQGEITSYQLNWDINLFGYPSAYLSQQLQSLVKEVENLSSIKRGGSDELDFDLDELDLEAELALLNTDPEVEKLAASKQTDKNEKDQNALKQLKEKYLKAWYDLLIAPLEKALPSHDSSITIIPDGVLSQFPFGAFCDKQGTYLIEKYAISLAPSIKTLQLLHQLPNEFPSTSLVVGSPDTGRATDYLEVADKEAKTVNSLLHGSQLLSQKEASISNVSQKMQEARFIHLACHGLAEKKYDKHSVFEGLFKLAPDESDSKGELYAQQIAALNLKAELVFLSACYSGKGNVKQEGSIGPVWSFLGAGAKSTVATYWPLPDSATTFEMVESFYQGILNTDRASLNKAQVLRQITLKAMAKNRDDFIQWGAFFLSGVSIDAKLD